MALIGTGVVGVMLVPLVMMCLLVRGRINLCPSCPHARIRPRSIHHEPGRARVPAPKEATSAATALSAATSVAACHTNQPTGPVVNYGRVQNMLIVVPTGTG